MPFFEEKVPLHVAPPQNEVALRWGEKVASLDGYIFVTAEYNHSIPAVLKNALDYLWSEIHRKPATFLGYGGGGAARAVEHLRNILATAQVASLPRRSYRYDRDDGHDARGQVHGGLSLTRRLRQADAGRAHLVGQHAQGRPLWGQGRRGRLSSGHHGIGKSGLLLCDSGISLISLRRSRRLHGPGLANGVSQAIDSLSTTVGPFRT
jgi:NAD(P)H-dependent FMN reductase